MNNSTETVHWLKVMFDAFTIVILLSIFEIIKVIAKPFKSSFYCDDYSINMPFKNSTVTNLTLIFICLISPFMVIISTEIVRNFYSHFYLNNKRTQYVYKVKLLKNKIVDIPEQIGNLYVNCGSFFFGLSATAVITDFGKVVVGRLRPNFLDVCKPNINPYTQLCSLKNITYLVPDVDFKCTSDDKPSIEDSRLSFPSGHASLSCYSMLFLILFINFTWNCRRFGLIPRLVQFFLFSIAVFTSLSRIVDNKHHPTDVLAGACLGTCISLITFTYLTDYLKKNNYKIRYCSLKSNNYDEENLPESYSIRAQSNFNLSDTKPNQN